MQRIASERPKQAHLYKIGDKIKGLYKGGPEVTGTIHITAWEYDGTPVYHVMYDKESWGPFYEEELSKVE